MEFCGQQQILRVRLDTGTLLRPSKPHCGNCFACQSLDVLSSKHRTGTEQWSNSFEELIWRMYEQGHLTDNGMRIKFTSKDKKPLVLDIMKCEVKD